MPETKESTAPQAAGTVTSAPLASASTGTEAQRKELMDLLRLHTDEVKYIVQLNWDRAKSSLTFHVTLLTLVASLKQQVLPRPVAIFLFFFTALSAALCARMLSISHGYYRAARDRRAMLEAQLNVPVRFGTTGTMRGEVIRPATRWWFKVHNIVIILHALLVVLALAAGISHWSA